MSLYRRDGSPYWWSKLYSHGSVVRFSTGERTKVAALRKEREEANRLDKEHAREGRYSLATLTAKFLIWKEANNRKPASVRAMRKHIELHILPFFGSERDVRDIQVSDLEEYKTTRCAAVGAGTVCKELATLRQVLRYGSEVHRLMEQAPSTRNPFHKYEPKWRLFTLAELRTLLHELSKVTGRGKEALPYFLLMANTGMRGGEVEALTWEMVDFAGRSIRLPGEVTKSRTPRTVPLNDAALQALRMRHARLSVGRVFHAGHHYDAWRKACHAAKVWPARPHDLRHTFGSMMHRAGRPGPEIRDILGHVTLSMENHYAHTFQEQLHEAVASVPKIVPLDGSNVPEKVRNGHGASNRKKMRSATGNQIKPGWRNWQTQGT